MTIQTFMRKEMKFLLSEEQLEALLPLIKQHMSPDAFCKRGQAYGIYNVYYDTPDDFLIRQSLSKPYYKEKLRLRAYRSPAGQDDTVFLEIKQKAGGVVGKRRAAMTRRAAERYMTHGARPHLGEDYLQRQVFGEIDAFCRRYRVQPKMYISCRRLAFFDKTDADFRMTFDFDLKARQEAVSLSKGDFGVLLLPGEACLMEVKISDAMPLWLCDALADLRIYKTGFSKYGKAYELFTRKRHRG